MKIQVPGTLLWIQFSADATGKALQDGPKHLDHCHSVGHPDEVLISCLWPRLVAALGDTWRVNQKSLSPSFSVMLPFK